MSPIRFLASSMVTIEGNYLDGGGGRGDRVTMISTLSPIRFLASSMVTVQSRETMSMPEAAMRSNNAPDYDNDIHKKRE